MLYNNDLVVCKWYENNFFKNINSHCKLLFYVKSISLSIIHLHEVLWYPSV